MKGHCSTILICYVPTSISASDIKQGASKSSSLVGFQQANFLYVEMSIHNM